MTLKIRQITAGKHTDLFPVNLEDDRSILFLSGGKLMFPWKREKKCKKYIRIFSGSQISYDGLIEALPLCESVIIQKSIQFFDDPEPCYIHRDAVRIRMLAELDQIKGATSLSSDKSPDLELLRQYTGIFSLTKAEWYEM